MFAYRTPSADSRKNGLARSAGQRVGGDRHEADRAANDVLIVRVDLEQVETVSNELEEEDAEHGEIR